VQRTNRRRWGNQWEEERRGHWDSKNIKVYYIYLYGDSIMKPTKYCFREGERREIGVL
jgi:hypothetical protein